MTLMDNLKPCDDYSSSNAVYPIDPSYLRYKLRQIQKSGREQTLKRVQRTPSFESITDNSSDTTTSKNKV